MILLLWVVCDFHFIIHRIHWINILLKKWLCVLLLRLLILKYRGLLLLLEVFRSLNWLIECWIWLLFEKIPKLLSLWHLWLIALIWIIWKIWIDLLLIDLWRLYQKWISWLFDGSSFWFCRIRGYLVWFNFIIIIF